MANFFANNIFKYIFVKGNVGIPLKISLKFVPKGPINNSIGSMPWDKPWDIIWTNDD